MIPAGQGAAQQRSLQPYMQVPTPRKSFQLWLECRIRLDAPRLPLRKVPNHPSLRW